MIRVEIVIVVVIIAVSQQISTRNRSLQNFNCYSFQTDILELTLFAITYILLKFVDIEGSKSF